MSRKTKIFVFHMKEVIYTGIFLFLALVFLILLAMMFFPKDNNSNTSSIMTMEQSDSENISYNTSDTKKYTPGIYTAALEVSGSTLELQLVIESDQITDVRFTQLDETIETMYPLFTPVLESICTQLRNGTPLEQITYEESKKYTAGILLEALESMMQKAAR